MGLNFNGASLENVYFNGTQLERVYMWDGNTESPTYSTYVLVYTSLIAEPIISVTSYTNQTIDWRITNNNDFSVTCYYEVGDSTPDLTTTISANSDFDFQSTSLSGSTSYELYSYFTGDSQTSGTVLKEQTTESNTATTPSILDYSASEFLGNVDVDWKVKNNDSLSGTVYTEVEDTSPDLKQIVLSGGSTSSNQSQDSVAWAGSSFVFIYAQTKLVSGKTDSTIKSQKVTVT